MNDWASEEDVVDGTERKAADDDISDAPTPKRRTNSADAGIVNADAAGTANNEIILPLIVEESKHNVTRQKNNT